MGPGFLIGFGVNAKSGRQLVKRLEGVNARFLARYCGGVSEEMLVKVVPKLRHPHKERRDELETFFRCWIECGGEVSPEATGDNEMLLLIWFRLRHAIALAKQTHKQRTPMELPVEQQLAYYLVGYWQESEELFWTWVLDSWSVC